MVGRQAPLPGQGLDVDGFKTDGGEHAWGHDLRYADGRRGDEGNNLFPVHYARTFGDLLRSEGKAPVTFSRAGSPDPRRMASSGPATGPRRGRRSAVL